MRIVGLIAAALLGVPTLAAAQNCPGAASACPPLSTSQINLGGPIVNQQGVPFVPPVALPAAGQVMTATDNAGHTAWQAGGTGSVTQVTVAPANGFSGSVATGTTTPTITLSTTVAGLLKGNGTAFSAAIPGTDYMAPNSSGAGLSGLTWPQIGSTPTTLSGYGITNGLATGNNLSDIPNPAAARGNLRVNPQTLAGRAPAGTDDSTQPYHVGASWGLGSTLFQAADTTVGFATWQQAQTAALPLDVLGIVVTNTTGAATGGTGYALGDILYFPGGATLKVLSEVGGVITQPAFTASISGAIMNVTSVGSGVIAVGANVFPSSGSSPTIVSDGTGTGGVGTYNLNMSLTLSSQSMISSEILTINSFANACPSLYSGPIAQVATAGSGTGATFSFTVLKPTAYGTRQLTKCYTGSAMTVARSDTGETKAISFLGDGGLDVATLDGFTSGQSSALAYTNYNSGVSARVSIWNDQGGGANDATQTTAANRPTISPGRLLGNARSVMFDSVGQSNGWHPTLTYLTVPTGVALIGNNNTLAMLAGTATVDFNRVAYLQLGCMTGGCLVFGFDKGVFNSGFELVNGNGTNIAPVLPFDGPMVAVGVNSGTGVTFDVGTTSTSWGAGNIGTGSVSGGTLGQAAGNVLTTGNIDESVVIMVPWAIPTATRLALEASIYHTFAVPPQQTAVIVAVGDSHVDDWGQPYQQSWPRQMMTLLNRQDITLVNAGSAGGQLSGFVSSGSWNVNVAPTLNASNSPYKFVMIEGGYNDIDAGQTVAQVEASFTTGLSETHTAGAKAVCVIGPLRTDTPTNNASMQTIAAWLRTNASCDYRLDTQAYSVFDAPTGPWPAPWYQSDQTHLTPAGAGLWAAMAAKVMAPLLP